MDSARMGSSARRLRHVVRSAGGLECATTPALASNPDFSSTSAAPHQVPHRVQENCDVDTQVVRKAPNSLEVSADLHLKSKLSRMVR